MQADGAPPQRAELGVAAGVGRRERRDVDGVADGLVAGGIYHVTQSLLGVLDASAFGVPVSEKHQLLLLPGPQAPDALPVHLEQTQNGGDN